MNKIKRTLLSLVLSGITAISSSGCNNLQSISSQQTMIHAQSNLFRKKLDLNHHSKSLKEILNYNHDNIKYIIDKEEYWPSPIAMIEKAENDPNKTIYEDCDGIALLNAYQAEKLGYPPTLLIISNGNILPNGTMKAHAVALLKKQINQTTKYGLLNTTRGIYPKYNSISELLKEENKICRTQNKKPYVTYTILDLTDLHYWKTFKGNLFPTLYFDVKRSKGKVLED